MYTKDEALTQLREDVNEIWTGYKSINSEIFQYSLGSVQKICSCIHLHDNLNDGLQKHSVEINIPDNLPNELDEDNLRPLKSIIKSFHGRIQHKLIQSILNELLEHSSVVTDKLDIDFFKSIKYKDCFIVMNQEFAPKFGKVQNEYIVICAKENYESIKKDGITANQLRFRLTGESPGHTHSLIVQSNDFPILDENSILLFDPHITVELHMKKIPTSFDMTKDLYCLLYTSPSPRD